jgi:hypothetical protein
MTKRILLAIVTVFCVAALSACSSAPASTTPVQGSVALETPASATPIQTATSTVSASPSKSAKPSSTSKASSKAAEDTSTSDGSGVSISQMIKEDSVNKDYQGSLKTDGEDIKVSIDGDTFTFNVTPDQDVKPADFTSEMQSQYKDDMNKQIQTIISEYPDIPDCIFAYNLVNHSGETLLNLTQYFKAE